MGSNLRSDFAKKCRDLRIAKHLKQREVAAIIGVALSTVGNMECSPYKVINRSRALALAAHYGLKGKDLDDFVRSWDACPLSPHGEKRKEYWKKRNELRSKAKNHDPMKCGLVECLAIILMDRPDSDVCFCDGDEMCSVCYSLGRIGATSPYTPADRGQILAQLAKMRDALLPTRVPVRASAPPSEPPSDEIFGG